MKNNYKSAVFCAILAALLYALNAPMSKLLLQEVPPYLMAALLYLGAGIGMLILQLVQKKRGGERKEERLARADLPYTVGMVVLDIAAPIFLMIGLRLTTAANASLLNNFEIVATSLIAFFVFKEAMPKKLIAGIALVTLSSILLSVEDMSSFRFSFGSLFVLLACVCWGLENNCTRMLSKKDPMEIVVIKGFGSGLGSLVIAAFAESLTASLLSVIGALILGFVAYGLSIFFYIYAQRTLGAAKTSAYYALSPFIGAGLSLLFFREIPSVMFCIALLVMVAGTYFVTAAENDTPGEG